MSKEYSEYLDKIFKNSLKKFLTVNIVTSIECLRNNSNIEKNIFSK
jgi:hypothetical protein